MKKLFVILGLLFASLAASANKIDELKIDSDVVRFLISLNKNFITGKNTPKLTIPPIDSVLINRNCFKSDTLSKTWETKSWQKADLNNDKRTDLVVTCHWYVYDNYVVMDNGNDTFKLISLRYNSEVCELVNVIPYRNQNLIVFHGIDTDILNRYFRPRTDTLIYKFDNFIEYNKHPPKYNIDSVILTNGHIEQGGCASCPDFNMTIAKNSNLSFDNYKYGGTLVKTKEGYRIDSFSVKTAPLSKSKLSTNERKKIFDLIKYLDIKRLKNQYAVPWTDASTSTIRLKFKDGTSKTIVDYGSYGTFGLRALFQKLYAISKVKNGI